jgi:D-alanine-D-alanine ligase
MAETRIRVLLLFGGRSAEHDVSRVTAVSIARALDRDRYEVVPVAITTDGRWLLAHDATRMLEGARDALPHAFDIEGTPVVPSADPTRAELVASDGRPSFAVDVVFPVLHGPYGEDGTVQGLLELAGLPYVGGGVLASALGMDKVAMKRAFRACGLPQAEYLEFRDGADRGDFCTRVERELGLPCFVKPANMGSSVGVTKAHDRAELEAAVSVALEYDEWILAEEAIVGREIEVAVLGDDPPIASTAGEIIPGEEFYSYADKYEADRARTEIPARLDAAALTTVRGLAVAAFEACRGEAMARVDFFYEEEHRERGFLLNELNTIPGFTPISMYPKLWAASGIDYPTLMDRLIELAIARHGRREKRAGRQRR